MHQLVVTNIQVLIVFDMLSFFRYLYVTSHTVSENDYQPQELNDEAVEENHYSQKDYSKIIPMMS